MVIEKINVKLADLPPAWISRAVSRGGAMANAQEIKKLLGEPIPQIVDPDDLHRFAVELRRFSSEVQERISKINRHFAKLAETWQDQEHEKFAGEFTHMLHVLTKFVSSSEEQVPVLLRKAESIRRYLEQR